MRGLITTFHHFHALILGLNEYTLISFATTTSDRIQTIIVHIFSFVVGITQKRFLRKFELFLNINLMLYGPQNF